MTAKLPPKSVKLPPNWSFTRALAVSPNGAHVLAASDPNLLCRIDIQNWTSTSMRPVDGGAGSLRVADDGRALIEGGSSAAPFLELRDAADATTKQIAVALGARLLEWDGGPRALLRLEPTVDREEADLAWAELDSGRIVQFGLTKLNSIAACQIGDSLLAFVSRIGAPCDSAYARLCIGAGGSIDDLGPAPTAGGYRSLARLSEDRLLLVPFNGPWCLLDGSGVLVAEGTAPMDNAVVSACAIGDSFVIANNRTRLSRRRATTGEEIESWKSKKAVDVIGAAGGCLLVFQYERLDLIVPSR
jgi:hypothetical protein